MSRALLAQLYVLRGLVDAVIVSVEETSGVASSPACEHPADYRRDTTTAGGPRKFLCLACNQEVEGVA
jgi:hypothetical protein